MWGIPSQQYPTLGNGVEIVIRGCFSLSIMRGEIGANYKALQEFRNLEVKSLIEYPPVVSDTETTISKIIGILKEKNAYDIFIHLAGTAVIGINVRDIISVRDIAATKPSILGKRIPTLALGDNVGHAARLMSLYRLRALPVIESHHGEIIGQISAKGIIKAMTDRNTLGTGRAGKKSELTSVPTEHLIGSMIDRISSSDIMTPNPTTIISEDKISTAKGVMVRHRIDQLPVVEKRKGSVSLVGIVTSSHIMHSMLTSERIGRKSVGIESRPTRLDLKISGIMDSDNLSVSRVDDSLRSIIDLMLNNNSTYTIVKSLDEIVGIITYRDVIALLGERVQEEKIPAFIVGLPDDPFDAELCKSKFTNLVSLLRRAYPEIEEARCHIKLRAIQGERKRYEVAANIVTPYRRNTYTNVGWDLAKMFDQMSDSMKKQLAHRKSRRQRGSVRNLT
jgi:CBS domain-containing protein